MARIRIICPKPPQMTDAEFVAFVAFLEVRLELAEVLKRNPGLPDMKVEFDVFSRLVLAWQHLSEVAGQDDDSSDMHTEG